MKKYLFMTDPGGDYHTLVPLQTGSPEEVARLFTREASDQDWNYGNCNQDDVWPEVSILTVSEEVKVDVRPILAEEDERWKAQQRKNQEQHERQQYEFLRNKFENVDQQRLDREKYEALKVKFEKE